MKNVVFPFKALREDFGFFRDCPRLAGGVPDFSPRELTVEEFNSKAPESIEGLPPIASLSLLESFLPTGPLREHRPGGRSLHFGLSVNLIYMLSWENESVFFLSRKKPGSFLSPSSCTNPSQYKSHQI